MGSKTYRMFHAQLDNGRMRLNSLFFFADIDECKEKKACQCPECSCKNTWGSYDCSCSGNLLYIRDHDTCISGFITPFIYFSYSSFEHWFIFFVGLSIGKTASEGRSAWAAFWIIILGLGIAAGGAYLVYKYRIRVSSLTYLQFCFVIYLHFNGILEGFHWK